MSNVSMLSDNVDAATSTLRAVTALVTCLAISAGLLSAIGPYLVVAFVVHQERRATAIRSALGASRAQVMRHHLRTSGGVMGAALPIELVLSLATAPLFADLAYGVDARDAGKPHNSAGRRGVRRCPGDLRAGPPRRERERGESAS